MFKNYFVSTISYFMLCITALLCVACSSTESGTNGESTNQQSKPQPKQTTQQKLTVALPPAQTEELHIAAISNLKMVLPILVSDFNNTYPNIKISLTIEPNNILLNKVKTNRQGYDIYLSGNQTYPKQFVATTQKGQLAPFTYARGQLVLYSHNYPMDISPTTTLDQLMLDNKSFSLAIANPQNLSYGMAAEAWLVNQNLYNNIKSKIVYTNNLEEAFILTDSGKADFGFVSLSQVLAKSKDNSLQSVNSRTNSYLILPKDSYPAILQDGIILNKPDTSQKFVDYLKSAKAQDVMTDAGFLPICTSTTILPACK